jgi:murein DD-endopeptidase MepM/ murein hydrolase activator NlpD
MVSILDLRKLLVAAIAAAALAGCNLDTMWAAPPAPDPAVPAGAPFGQIMDGQYVVAPGDTVAIVADRTNTPIRSLIDLNRLTPPYILKAGQRLDLAPRGSYVVQKGDTVSRIAASQGVSISALIQLNNLRPPYTLQIGQALVLPTGVDAPGSYASAPQAAGVYNPQPKPFVPQGSTNVVTQAGTPQPAGQPGGGISSGNLPPLQGANAGPAPAPTTVTPAPVFTPQPAQPTPPAQTQTAQIQPPPPKPAPAGDPLPVLKPNSPFIWPVAGKVVSKFGPAKDNQRNDGVNIAAPDGAPVKASADGVVAYAGNELRGFGNMVLLRHADGWVTAYAHNSSLLVKKGDKVRQGQTIARVGSTGNVETPQLHFELRQGTKAVDPLRVLTR